MTRIRLSGNENDAVVQSNEFVIANVEIELIHADVPNMSTVTRHGPTEVSYSKIGMPFSKDFFQSHQLCIIIIIIIKDQHRS